LETWVVNLCASAAVIRVRRIEKKHIRAARGSRSMLFWLTRSKTLNCLSTFLCFVDPLHYSKWCSIWILKTFCLPFFPCVKKKIHKNSSQPKTLLHRCNIFSFVVRYLYFYTLHRLVGGFSFSSSSSSFVSVSSPRETICNRDGPVVLGVLKYSGDFFPV